jgi:hypothetical protein
MAKEVVQQRGLAIRLACAVFSISGSCYRYESKQNAENEEIANWLIRLTDIGSKTALQRLNPKRRKPRTYPHREHLLLTKSVGQYSMGNSGQTSAEFNNHDRPNMALGGFTPKQHLATAA